MNKAIYLHLGETDPKLSRSWLLHSSEADRIHAMRASHFFGSPVMPPEYPMPMIPHPAPQVPYQSAWDGKSVECPKVLPMPLLCQINLADLPENEMLPNEGHLLVFADYHYYDNIYGGEPNISMDISDADNLHVVYIPKEDTERMDWRDDSSRDNLNPISLTFNDKKPTLEEPDMQLFGYTDHLEWEDWPEPCEGWQLLLQVDSMEWDDVRYVLNFVDWGVLCFLIEPEALKRRDFSNVRAIILST